MKRCPTCQSEYEDRYVFCQKDGTTLIVAPAKAVTVSGESIADPASAGPAASKGIEENGRGIVSSILTKHRIPALIVAGLLIATAIAVAGYHAFPSTKRSVLAEVSKGNLVKPEGGSAYDLYLRGKANLSSSDVSEIAGQVAPALETRADEIMSRQKQPGFESDADMAEALRIYSWLNDVRPKPAYESRRFFAEGRLAFTKKDFNRAMTAYRRSVELDSSWALPFNGIGRVYVNQNDYDNARQYYTQATQVEPRWISPWMNLGELTFLRSDFYSAENAARRVLELDSQKASAHHLLARVFEKQERWCDAIREYQLSVQSAGNSTSPGFDVDAARRRSERLAAKYPCS